MVSRGATFIAPLPGTPPVGMSATDGRLALGGIFGVTPQLVSGGGISQSGSNMQFTLAQSVFQLADVTNAAATAFLPTDSIVLTPAAGPGTGSRIDLICIPLKNYENGDGTSQSTPILVAGPPGSPGLVPPTPAGSYKYAQILVPTSAATAAACTVTIYGNTTYAPPSLNVPSFALLPALGQVNQLASTPDGRTFRWNGTAWGMRFPHAEFTTSATAVADNALMGAGTVTVDSTKTTDTTFYTIISNGVTLQPGLYAVQWRALPGGNTTGRTFLSITDGTTEYARSSIANPEDTGSVAAPNVYLTVASNIVAQFLKNVGSASTVTGRLRVTKLG